MLRYQYTHQLTINDKLTETVGLCGDDIGIYGEADASLSVAVFTRAP